MFPKARSVTARSMTTKTNRPSTTAQKTSVQDPSTSAWTRSDIAYLPWIQTLMPWKWDQQTLAPYQKYSKLFGERKFAKSQPKQCLRFLDLPPEIRNQIYRQVLVFGNGIDLAPKSTRAKGNGFAWKQHRKRYRYNIIPRLKLLRTNKQLHEEATPIFYGENEFHFTNCKGWYVLSAFLRTIGRENSARLRSIAIHVPWYGEVADNQYDQLPESHGTMSWMMRVLRSMGLDYVPWWKSFKMDASVSRCKKLLESCGTLESVKLILPDTFKFRNSIYINGCMPVSDILDASKFGNRLHISLVGLHGGYKFPGYEQNTLDELRRNTIVSQRPARDMARALGWTMETVVYDKTGKYPVPLKEGDRIIDIDDAADDEG